MFLKKKRRRELVEKEFMPHMDSLYRYAVHLTRDPDIAEDLTQETMLKAVENWDKYNPGTNAKAWLFRIMSNHHLNTRRRARKRPDNPLLFAEEGAPFESVPSSSKIEPDLCFVQGLAREQILSALDDLPLESRQMIVLADIEGFSYKEIANTLSCPIGTVMSRLFRARRLMRRRLVLVAQELGLKTPELDQDEEEDQEMEGLVPFRRFA